MIAANERNEHLPKYEESDEWMTTTTQSSSSPKSTPHPSTLDELRHDGEKFEQRQLQLDLELERLSQQLAEATPPREQRPVSTSYVPSYYDSMSAALSPPLKHTALTRVSQDEHHEHQEHQEQQHQHHPQQRHYNWRSPGPLLGETAPVSASASGVSARVSRRGSIIIERSSIPQAVAPPPPPQQQLKLQTPPIPQLNASILDDLQQQHDGTVQQLRNQIQQLHGQCMDLRTDNQEIVNELSIVKTKAAHLISQQTHESESASQELQRTRAALGQKSEELGLLRDQQDRTMSLLNTCTQQRDLLVEDNRMLRQELDQLLRRFHYNTSKNNDNGINSDGSSTRSANNQRRSPKKMSSVSSPPRPQGVPNDLWSASLRGKPSPDKIFVSSNRRGSTVNPKESSYQVHNMKTSAGEW